MRAQTSSTLSPPSDTLGCQSNQLAMDQEFIGNGLRLYRKRTGDQPLAQVVTPATERGVLVGLSLRAGHRRRIFHGSHSSLHAFGDEAVYVRNFCDDYRADLIGPFDFVLLELSREALDRIAEEEGGPRHDGLTAVAGTPDPVLAHLCRALMPALDRPAEASRLFVDHLAMAAGIHLLGRYGHLRHPQPARSRGLSLRDERRAKELMRSRLDGEVSIAEVADACGLSRSYFIRAFCQATGQTPHRWLLRCRIEHARGLLAASPLTLAEVAAACGFADQSHFTRVFAQMVGMPPGQWRRQAPLPGTASRVPG